MTEIKIGHVISCYRCPDKFCKQVLELPEKGRLMYNRDNPKEYPIWDWQPIKECILYKRDCHLE